MPFLTIDQYTQRTPRGAILNFGPPMTGKTKSISTLNLWPVWIFDFDGNAEPLVRAARELGLPQDAVRIYTYRIPGGQRIQENQHRPKSQGSDLFMQFLKDFNSIHELIDPKTGEWKVGVEAPAVVAMDSCTQLQIYILDWILVKVGHDLGAPNTHGGADYGMQMRKLEEIVDSAKSLPCVSIFNAHQKDNIVRDKDTGAETLLGIEPMVTGQLSSTFAKAFGITVYSKVRKVGQVSKYFWQHQSDGLIKGLGTRYADGPPAETEQDYKLIIPRLGEKGKAA